MSGDTPAKMASASVRIVCLISSCLAIVTLGAIYALPVWLLKLKIKLDLNQTQMNLLGAMNYIPGGFTMLLAPLLLDTIGPLYALSCAITSDVTGYVVLWLANKGTIPNTVWVVSGGMILVRASTGVFFPFVIGNLQTMYGQNNNLWVCAMISSSFSLGGLVFSFVFYKLNPTLEHYFFGLGSFHLGLLPVVCGVVLFASKRFTAAPAATSPKELNDPSRPLLSNEHGINGINGSPEDQMVAPVEAEAKESFWAFTVAMGKSSGFWLVCTALFLQIGVGGTYATNLGAVIVAAGGTDDKMGSDVALAAVVLNGSQLFGRVCLAIWSSPRFRCGLTSDQQTLIVLAFVGVTYAITFGLAAEELSLKGVYAVTVFFGIGYGMMWTITGSLFAFTPRPEGKHFPRTAGLVYPFGGLGNLAFNEMTGALYDYQSRNSPTHTCTGRHCYELAFLVMMGVSGGILILAVVLWRHSVNKSKKTAAAAVAVEPGAFE